MNIYKQHRLIHAKGPTYWSLCERIVQLGAKETGELANFPQCLMLLVSYMLPNDGKHEVLHTLREDEL